MSATPIFWGVIAVLAFVLLSSAINVLREYERGVIFFLGRFDGVKGPGLILVWPIIQKMVRVDLRTIVLDVPKQDVISRDNVSVKVNAVVYFRIVDPSKAIIQVVNPFEATSQLAQTTLRSVLGQHELDEMLSERERLNAELEQRVADRTAALEATTAALQEADRRKDEFLAILAHELRNPLAPIRTAVQLLRKRELAEAQTIRAREVIERQVQHLVCLIDDLLDVSRITRGMITLQRERVLIDAVVARAVETVRPLIDARKHELALDLPHEGLDP